MSIYQRIARATPETLPKHDFVPSLAIQSFGFVVIPKVRIIVGK